MSAIFNPVITQVLLNSSAKVSEQLPLLALKIFGGIFPNVLAFLISNKEASLKENDAGFCL